MPIYPYSFQLPPLNVQDIPNDGAPGEFLGINVGGALDWLPVASGGGDMLKSENLSGLANYTTARTNIGLGTASTPTFANLTLTSPSLSSSAPVTISQTWGTTGTYTAAKVNVTETATANSASRLFDAQIGGVSKFSVNKGGGIVSKANIITANGDAGAAGLSLEMVFANYGLGIDANGNTAFLVNGTAKSRAGFGVAIASDQSLSFTNTTHVGINATPDTILLRDGAANTLALRNGTSAQTFRVYNTYTDASNYERGFLGWSSNNFRIGTEQGGGNAARRMDFIMNGSTRICIGTNGNVGIGVVDPNTTTLQVNGSFSASGNVGIGTTAPGAKLEVVGNILVNGATQIIDDGNILSVKGSTTNAFKAGYIVVTSGDNLVTTYQGSVTSGGFFGTFTNHKCFIRTSNVERVTIDTVGNVGIGTTSPTSKLHVALNPAANYTTETVRFGNIHFANGTGGYSNLWMGSISTPLTLSASNYTLANDGTNTIINGGSGGLFFHVGAAAHWNIQSTGHLLCSSDNSRDIGASGANRPRNVYVAGNVSGVGGLHSGGTSLITFSNSTSLTYAENGAYHVALQRNGNGILALLQSGGGWDRLQLGGTTDAFPAVARDGAGIKFTGAAAGSTAWIKVPPVAVSALPLAATAGAGARAFVNDALAPTFGSAVTGGGSGLVPVYSDGSAWNVG